MSWTVRAASRARRARWPPRVDRVEGPKPGEDRLHGVDPIAARLGDAVEEVGRALVGALDADIGIAGDGGAIAGHGACHVLVGGPLERPAAHQGAGCSRTPPTARPSGIPRRGLLDARPGPAPGRPRARLRLAARDADDPERVPTSYPSGEPSSSTQFLDGRPHYIPPAHTRSLAPSPSFEWRVDVEILGMGSVCVVPVDGWWKRLVLALLQSHTHSRHADAVPDKRRNCPGIPGRSQALREWCVSRRKLLEDEHRRSLEPGERRCSGVEGRPRIN